MTTRTNEQWIAELKNEGAERKPRWKICAPSFKRSAVCTLALALARSAAVQFTRRRSDAKALLRVLSQLGTFGERRIDSPWVHKIAVRIALTELRRKRWRDSS
ncbi:MAG: hypothetical protein U0V48_14280 [Anaerolineales bacterium]